MNSLSKLYTPAPKRTFGKKALLVALAVAAAFAGAQAHAATPFATSWEVASEFTETLASPVWTYGYKSGSSNTLNAFLPMNANSTACLSGWTTGLPIVAHNPALSSCTFGSPTLTLGPRALLLHPGASGEAAVVRFKAPYSAQYRVSGQFYGIDANGTRTHTNVSIMANLSATNSYTPYAASVAVNSPTTPGVASFTSFYVMLQGGQTLDFAVKAGPGNNYWYGSTGLNAVIERSGDWCGLVNPDVPSSSTC